MSVDPCPKCGKPHIIARGKAAGQPSCTGHATGGRTRPERRGQPCQRSPKPGSDKCATHGISTPAGKAAAARRVTEAKVAALAARFTDPVAGDDQDPGSIIAEQITMQYRLVHWLRARAVAVDPDAFMWGITKEKVGGDDGGVTSEAKPNAWYAAFLEASHALNKLCLEAVRVGVEVRRQQLEERAAAEWVTQTDRLLMALGLDPNAPKVAEVVERHLRSIA